MAPPKPLQTTSNEGRILLAISALQSNQISSIRTAAALFEVPKTTLIRRLQGIPSRQDTIPIQRNLSPIDEEVLIQKILELDKQGHAPSVAKVKEFANIISKSRGGQGVGTNWTTKFIKRCPQLKTKMSKRLDYQRARCEDNQTITQWFELVRRQIQEHGIQTEDIYNFDETGFQMGLAGAAKVVTSSNRVDRPKKLQATNKEWVTVISCIGTQGYIIPPFVIFKGKQYNSAWFNKHLPSQWAFSMSDNGWTTNQHGLQWIQHFNKHTEKLTKGIKRLLVLDGHASHQSMEFLAYCLENKIVCLYMPPHSSHLLQPLDVGCFGPLKKAYYQEIDSMIKNHILAIGKLDFLAAFQKAHQKAMTRQNIIGAFRGSGLYPFNPQAVLSKLDVRIRTPSPLPEPGPSTWTSKTPSNAQEVTCQSSFIQDKLIRHQNSSPTPIHTALIQLAKGAQQMATSAALMQSTIQELQRANEEVKERKTRKRKRFQIDGYLTVSEGQALLTQSAVNNQITTEITGNEARTKAPTSRRCGICRAPGHTKLTCPARIQLLPTNELSSNAQDNYLMQSQPYNQLSSEAQDYNLVQSQLYNQSEAQDNNLVLSDACNSTDYEGD